MPRGGGHVPAGVSVVLERTPINLAVIDVGGCSDDLADDLVLVVDRGMGLDPRFASASFCASFAGKSRRPAGVSPFRSASFSLAPVPLHRGR